MYLCMYLTFYIQFSYAIFAVWFSHFLLPFIRHASITDSVWNLKFDFDKKTPLYPNSNVRLFFVNPERDANTGRKRIPSVGFSGLFYILFYSMSDHWPVSCYSLLQVGHGLCISSCVCTRSPYTLCQVFSSCWSADYSSLLKCIPFQMGDFPLGVERVMKSSTEAHLVACWPKEGQSFLSILLLGLWKALPSL